MAICDPVLPQLLVSAGSRRDVAVTVRCLACSATYAKPNGRGTVRTNPGCPKCGYLGWEQVKPRA